MTDLGFGMARGDAMIVFSIVIAAASLAVFVVALNGYSVYPYTLLYSAWGKASGTNLISDYNGRITVYLGFRIVAYTWTINGANYISSIGVQNSSCSDAGSTAAALLIAALFGTSLTLVLNCCQMTTNTTSLKYAATFFSMSAVILSAVAWATWYQTCYIDQYSHNSNLSDLSRFGGINCAIAGMSLMFVAMCLNGLAPVLPAPEDPAFYSDGPLATPGRTAAGTYGPYSNVQTPVQGKVIGVVA